LLLKDPRVDVTLGDNDGCTPLWHASYYGRNKVIEWLIASDRDLGIEQKGKWGNIEDYTALEIARKENKTEAVSVLERFTTNPAQTRYEIRVKLGMLDEVAAEVFALTVFLCDDLLRLKPALPITTITASAATRFFTITKRLPMELQMMLCHRNWLNEAEYSS